MNMRASELRSPNGVPRVALKVEEAAASIGMSESSFRRHVLHELRVVHATPRLKLIRIAELERWLERHEALDSNL
jgi:hypothetical protein